MKLTGINLVTLNRLILVIIFSYTLAWSIDKKDIHLTPILHDGFDQFSSNQGSTQFAPDSFPASNPFYVGVQTKPIQRNLSQRDVFEQYVQAVLAEAICRQKYHMTLAQKDKLMSTYRYKKFTQQLLADDTLPDEVVLELWQQFCDLKDWPFGNDRWQCDQQIKCTLKERKEKRMAAAKQPLENLCKDKSADIQQEVDEKSRKYAQAQISKRYQLLHDFSDYVSPYHEQRQQVFQKTIEQNYLSVAKSYVIDAQTKALLALHNIDVKFQNLVATTMQHQIVSEVAASYKKVAKAVFEYGLKGTYLIPEAVSAAAAAHEVTMLDEVAIAAQLSDLADAMAEATLTIGRSVVQSLAGAVSVALRPDQIPELVGAMMKPIKSLAYTAGKFLATLDHMCDDLRVYQQLQQSWIEDLQYFQEVSALCLHEFSELSGQQQIETMTKLYVDGRVCDKVIRVFAGALKRIGPVPATTASAAHELSVVEVAEDLIHVASEEVKVATTMGEVERGLTSCMNSDAVIAKYGVNFAEIAEKSVFMAEFHKLGGRIRATETVLIKHVNKALKTMSAQLEKTCLKHLTQKYAQRTTGDVTTYAAIEHFCNAELKLSRCKKTGDMVLDISGGHLYGAYEAVERAGFIKIIEKKPLPGGAFEYHMEDVFTNRSLTKTVFPKSWDAKKVCDVAWCLYEVSGIAKETMHGFKKRAMIDGINLELHCSIDTKQAKLKHKIVTCYPCD